jgi:hypothetical protein
MARHLTAVPVLLVCAAVGAQAPPGYKTYENKLQRVAFAYPTVYEEMPLPPTEQVSVAKFLLKKKPEELKRIDDAVFDAFKPQLEVFHFALPAPKTGAQPSAAEGEGAGDANGKPTTVREAMEAQSRVASWREFTERLGPWRLEEDPKKAGHFTMVFTGQWGLRGTMPTGTLVRKQEGSDVFGVWGVALSEYGKQMQAQVGKVAGTMRLAAEDSSEAAAAAIEKLYASGQFRAVDFRKQARGELAKGWKALDTENFLIVHHSKNEALIRRIARDIEAMRLVYLAAFPPTGAMDRLAIVRICRTKEEYHQYGGPPSSGGYWHPGNEELVFFDYSYTRKTLDDDERKRLGRAKLTDDDSLLVLYHEALHQYMHYAVGEFAPHDWFNEGFGDYFSGAVVGEATGRVLRIDPSPWRIHTAKDMCEHGVGFIPLAEILEAERAKFYHPARVRYFYAGAWSFVYFLKHSKEAAAHPQWSRLLPTYFEAMKAGYASEIAKVSGTPDLGQKTVAGAVARKAALQQALAGIDVAELQKVWRKWVVDMKDPWPSKRPKPAK